jgi:hypothetical protein
VPASDAPLRRKEIAIERRKEARSFAADMELVAFAAAEGAAGFGERLERLRLERAMGASAEVALEADELAADQATIACRCDLE